MEKRVKQGVSPHVFTILSLAADLAHPIGFARGGETCSLEKAEIMWLVPNPRFLSTSERIPCPLLS